MKSRYMEAGLGTLCGLLLVALVVTGCGEEKKSKGPSSSDDETATATQVQPGQPAKEASGEQTPPSYAPPTALSPGERKSRYPEKKMRLSKRKNRAAYKLRKKGNSEGALAGYLAAIELSPAYEPSYFNAACEYAMLGQADKAIEKIEDLYRMGTHTAQRYISATRYDSDFDKIRQDPRLVTIANSFSVNFDEPLFKQLCADLGRADTLVDSEKGLYDYSPGNGDDATSDTAKVVTGSKARKVFREAVLKACGGGPDGKRIGESPMGGLAVSDTKLSKWAEKHDSRCVDISTVVDPDCCSKPNADEDYNCTCGARDNTYAAGACFVKKNDGWTVGLAFSYYEDHGADITHDNKKKFVKKAVGWHQ
jgi:tetratricopeptide (TPR) repeat protein